MSLRITPNGASLGEESISVKAGRDLLASFVSDVNINNIARVARNLNSSLIEMSGINFRIGFDNDIIEEEGGLDLSLRSEESDLEGLGVTTVVGGRVAVVRIAHVVCSTNRMQREPNSSAGQDGDHENEPEGENDDVASFGSFGDLVIRMSGIVTNDTSSFVGQSKTTNGKREEKNASQDAKNPSGMCVCFWFLFDAELLDASVEVWRWGSMVERSIRSYWRWLSRWGVIDYKVGRLAWSLLVWEDNRLWGSLLRGSGGWVRGKFLVSETCV